VLPLGVVDSINISAWLKRQPAPRPSRRNLVSTLVDLRHIDALTRVHLKRRLRRRHLEVDSVAVVQRDRGPEVVAAGVDTDFLGVVLEDEAVVDKGFFFVEGEALAGGDVWELCDFASGKRGVVDDLVQVGEELDLGTGDCGFAGQVPEAGVKRY